MTMPTEERPLVIEFESTYWPDDDPVSSPQHRLDVALFEYPAFTGNNFNDLPQKVLIEKNFMRDGEKLTRRELAAYIENLKTILEKLYDPEGEKNND